MKRIGLVLTMASSLVSISASIFILSFVGAVLSAGLYIETLEKPDKCKKLSKQGDWLKVHYKGTLQSDGTQFDSRYL